MAQFLIESLFISAFVLSANSHIIGGGLNTDFSINGNAQRSNTLFKSVISTLNLPRSYDNSPANTEPQTVEHSGSRLNNKETRSIFSNGGKNRQGSRIKSLVLPGLGVVNPFSRQKREACSIPATIVQNISQILSLLNDTMFLSLPNEPVHSEIPADEPSQCPTGNQVWSNKTPDRLRATCPWNISELDLGHEAYPRYVPQATCLCDNCIGSPAKRCANLWYNVTYFERTGCKYGAAVMTKKIKQIVIGCYCPSEKSQGSESEVTVQPPTDFS